MPGLQDAESELPEANGELTVMTSTLGQCPCGQPAIGSVNDRLYCGKVECINRAMEAATKPVKDARKKAGLR